jgi:hypothetical protein
MRYRKSLLDVLIIWIAISLMSVLSSCGRDEPAVTMPGQAGEPDPSQIDINEDGVFSLGSAVIDGFPRGRVDVWGYNLVVELETIVSFDIVLTNRLVDVIYPPLYFYITKVVPAEVHLVNADWKGFNRSWVFDMSDNLGVDARLNPGESTLPTTVRFEMPRAESFAIGFRVTVGGPPINPGCLYPTVVHRPSPEDLQSLRAEFASQNPNMCSGLSEFGFTTGVCSGKRDLPDDTDVDALIAEAKSALVKNAQFTGVQDASDLTVRTQILFSGYLQVYFGRQQYEGLGVVGTEIRVHLDSGGVTSIHGNNYAEM